MIAQATFLALSFLGFLNAGYLASKHRAKEPLVCPLNHNCSVVTESRWARIFGVRNDWLGMLFFFCLAVGILVAFFDPGVEMLIYPLLRLASIAGVLFSGFLIAIQIVKIKDYCFYCMISAGITLFLCINAFLL